MSFKMLHLIAAVFLIPDHTSGLRKHFIVDDLEHLLEEYEALEDRQNSDSNPISRDGNNENDVKREAYSEEALDAQADKKCISDEHLIPHGDKGDHTHKDIGFPREKMDVPEVHRCCSRSSKIMGIGFDMAGSEQFLDVGDCSKSCSHQKKHTHHRHHGYRPSVTAEDEVITPLSLPDAEEQEDEIFRNIQHCPLHHHCEATATIVKRHHLLNGPAQVSLIKECDCVSWPATCSRTENIVIHYPDTPYERVTDIGKCAGKCGENGLTCNPARNKTLFIEGPNGGICVSVIEECGCSPSCYRMKFYESLYQNVWNYDTNTTEEEIVEIDVGKCVGKCDDELNFHCVLRDSIDPEKCLMSLKKPKAQCVPVELKIHTFETSSGEVKNVAAVENCGCK